MGRHKGSLLFAVAGSKDFMLLFLVNYFLKFFYLWFGRDCFPILLALQVCMVFCLMVQHVSLLLEAGIAVAAPEG